MFNICKSLINAFVCIKTWDLSERTKRLYATTCVTNNDKTHGGLTHVVDKYYYFRLNRF